MRGQVAGAPLDRCVKHRCTSCLWSVSAEQHPPPRPPCGCHPPLRYRGRQGDILQIHALFVKSRRSWRHAAEARGAAHRLSEDLRQVGLMGTAAHRGYRRPGAPPARQAIAEHARSLAHYHLAQAARSGHEFQPQLVLGFPRFCGPRTLRARVITLIRKER